jgi:aspartate aminotransferase
VRISKRASATQESPIQKLVPREREAEKKGIRVLRLNIGQSDIETPEFALRAVRGFGEPVLSYAPSEGFLTLRRRVAAYLGSFGLAVEPDHVAVTTGASEALHFSLAAVCDAGDNVIVPEPFYANFKSIASMLGVDLVPVTTYFQDGYHITDERQIEGRINGRTRAILFCNPSNPTGMVFTQKEIELIARAALEHDLFIISDEVYREFLYDGVEFITPLSMKSVEKRVIVTDSISNRFSSCGARIGFLVTKNEEVMRAVNKFAMARIAAPTIDQRLAEKAFEMEPSYLIAVVGEYKARRDVLIEELAKEKDLTFRRPEGAFYMMVKLRGTDSEDFARFLLEDFRIEGETVMVAPGPGFYATGGLGRDEIRIAFVLDKDKIRRAARIVREGFSAYKSRERKTQLHREPFLEEIVGE